MGWPGLAEYNAALLRAPASLKSPDLRDYRLALGPLGMPMPVSGGYAYIYELRNSQGGRKAFRCFREDDPPRRSRAAAVCRGLSKLRADRPELASHFIHTLWEERCLETASGTVPAMVMGWAEGATLGARLEALQDKPAAFVELRERIAGMLRLLEDASIVHGDLQTGNILIKYDGTPLLIDYDGLILPGDGLGAASPDLHPNFQHPEWDEACDPAIKDRFPSIVIDLGLAAMAERPELFGRYSTGENVIFTEADLAEPEASPLFAELRAMPSLSRAAELLAGLSLGPVSGVPSLSQFREEAYKLRPGAAGVAVVIAPQAPSGATGGPSAKYRGVYPVFDAKDYAALAGAVGDKVEVIGRVVEVKRAKTKYGKPYAFVNFGYWRNDCFKLTVWSEGLATFRQPPGEDWEERWVSATGLIDEPYHSPRYGTTQLSITIQDASQLRFIDEAEARRRLNKNGASNTDWRYATAGAARPAQAQRSTTSQSTKPSNQELLERLQRGALSQPTPQVPASSSSGGSSPVTKQGESGGCLNIISYIMAFIFVFFLLITLFSR